VVCVYILIRKGVPIYNHNVVTKGLGVGSLTWIHKAQLGERIPFVHQSNPTSDWWVFHHGELAKEIGFGPDNQGSSQATPKKTLATTIDAARVVWNIKSPGYIDIWKTLSSASVDTAGKKLWDSLKDALDIDVPNGKYSAALRDSIGYLTSLNLLPHYFDGISFLRAITVAPDDPWSQFEPQKFGNYKDTIEGWLRESLEGKKSGLTNSGRFGDGSSNAAAWADKMTDDVLMKIYTKFCGHAMNIRDESVRAGGDEPGENFQCTPGQAAVMQSSPYLETYVTQKDTSYTCHYFYPDAAHMSKIVAAGYLKSPPPPATPDLATLSTTSAEGEPFKTGTKALLRQLIRNVFFRIYNQPLSYPGAGLDVMLDLVGIHPATDCNGRSTRGIGILAMLEAGQEPVAAFLGDFDLVSTKAQYGAFLTRATEQYKLARHAWFVKTLNVVFSENRKVTSKDLFQDTPETKALAQSLDAYLVGVKGITLPPAGVDPNTFWGQVASRKWIDIMATLGGTTWKGYASASAIDLNKH